MKYGLIVFRSRKETLQVRKLLSANGINANIMNTPRKISIACGISLRVDMGAMQKVKTMIRYQNFRTFVGLYTVGPENNISAY